MGDGPWHIDIRPWASWAALAPVTNPAFVREPNVVALGGGWASGAFSNSAAAWIEWDVALTAGTWRVTYIGQHFVNRGIATLTLDGTPIGTIDNYATGAVENAVTQLAGIVVGTDAVRRLRIATPTKNAASSAYFLNPCHLSLDRTA